MLPKSRTVVSRQGFKKVFRDEARIVEFSSPEEESAYEKRDAALISLIRRVCEQHFGKNEGHQPFVMDDWWPDHTRGIEATPTHCTTGFFNDLHGLLKNDHKQFRIQICVYDDAKEAKPYIGSIVLYADHILIEENLETLLKRLGTQKE